MVFKIVYWLAYIVLWPFYRFSFSGRENLPIGACLVCANHTAIIDSVLMVLSLGPKGDYAVMAKAELFKNPLFGAVLRFLRVFPVNRSGGDIAAVKAGFNALRQNRKLLLFPEGTRVREGQTSEAKSGAGMFALRGNVPVQPIYIPAGRKAFKRNVIVFGKPFTVVCEGKAGAKEYAELSASIMRQISQLAPKSAQLAKGKRSMI